MTDEDLIAALGWEPCAIDTCQQWCAAHAMDYSGLDSDGPCLRMYERLIGASAGIDLARTGIAERLDRAADAAAEACVFPERDTGEAGENAGGLARATVIARGWQP